MIPKVSIIMPVYQVECFLPESLHSVRTQGLKEIEIICVDDGSHDGCPELLDQAAREDDRIKVLHNENHGYGYTINDGFSHATGEYLAILEPDDVFPERALETLYHLAVQHDADLVKGDYCEMRTGADGSRSLVPAWLHEDEGLYGSVFNAMERPSVLMSHIINCSGIVRRSLVLQHGIKLSETPGASYQDVSLFFPLMIHSRRIFFTHQITYLYRNDNPGASTKSRGKLFDADQEYIKALKYLDAVSDDQRLRSAVWCARWRGALGTLSRIDPVLYTDFLRYLRPLTESAWKDGDIRRGYCSAYQWAMLQRFLRSDKSFLRAFSLSNGKMREPVRLWWRLRYHGILRTIRFLGRKKAMRAMTKDL